MWILANYLTKLSKFNFNFETFCTTLSTFYDIYEILISASSIKKVLSASLTTPRSQLQMANQPSSRSTLFWNIEKFLATLNNFSLLQSNLTKFDAAKVFQPNFFKHRQCLAKCRIKCVFFHSLSAHNLVKVSYKKQKKCSKQFIIYFFTNETV